MTPQAFIAHWLHNDITERAGAQQHFNDLCDLLDVEKPRDPENYCFERGAKTPGGQGWADVWKRGCFAWEYKAPGRDLAAALKQLMNYALALDNPPLLVVSDLRTIEIHTHFTGHPSDVHRIAIADLTQPEARQKLLWLFTDPERFKPARTIYAVTEQAAGKMGDIAGRLTDQGNAPLVVAHFLIQCVFCMFAEDAKLLPEKLFETVLDRSNPDGGKARKRLTELFTAMRGGGDFAMLDIPWFNGGLFETIEIPTLQTKDVANLLEAARMDWSQIEPAILGTLFERGLNPDMRSQLGAHYTDPATIMKLIRPVIETPLLAEWEPIKAIIADNMKKYEAGGKGSKTAHSDALNAFNNFLLRLKNYRVLDAACGSGNFLYLALKALKDIEHRVNLEAEKLNVERKLTIDTSPANVLGIEINPYAAELARVTIWIGEIQWMLAHGYPFKRNPILAKLDHIECRDAVLNYTPSNGSNNSNTPLSPDAPNTPLSLDGRGAGERVKTPQEAEWPQADVIVGNPPFLGGSKKRGELGDDYFNALNAVYDENVPGGADLVCYWFEKARKQIETGQCTAAGLVATQAIRAGSNRKVLDAIINSVIPREVAESMPSAVDSATTLRSAQNDNASPIRIFTAWSDEPWVNNGAAVRVSLVCFGKREGAELDGVKVESINADLTAGGDNQANLTEAKSLAENADTAFEGTKKYGDFDIAGDVARGWLTQPNPNGKSNSLVVKPWANGQDIAKRPSDTWIIDFGTNMSEAEAAQFELPFRHVLEHVKAYRQTVSSAPAREAWWLHERSRAKMRTAIQGQHRFIITPRVAKHRYFVWLSSTVLPDTRLCVITRSDDTTFGILSSRIHMVWAFANASMHGVGNDPTYNVASCFETFPFPEGMTPRDTQPRHSARSEAKSQNPQTLMDPATSRRMTTEANTHNDAAQTIAQAAANLNQLRNNWLNPPEWTNWQTTPEEQKAGFPKRPVPKPGFENDLKRRTLTNLYNQRPAWLDMAHKELDKAVADAYGWTDYTPEMPDEEILRRLLGLNQKRALRKI
ncbi:MAG: hypothetical protein LBV44_05655 [Methylobacillus sp.]|jgi:hypothetical protein|nr:hypothetical protein [Methylobacillus sp.]